MSKFLKGYDQARKIRELSILTRSWKCALNTFPEILKNSNFSLSKYRIFRPLCGCFLSLDYP